MNLHYSIGLQTLRSSAIIIAILSSCLFLASSEAAAQDIRYDVKLEKRYYLADKVSVVFSLTNIGPKRITVKDILMSKIRLQLKGPFNDEKTEEREFKFDGSHGVVINMPEEGINYGGLAIISLPLVKKPDVTLRTGQSTGMKWDDLFKNFSAEKGGAPGVYTLTVWFDYRQKVTKKFRVEVDGERTYQRLLQMLRGGDETTMNWASYYLHKIDEKRALGLFRSMLQSDKQWEKDFALKYLGSWGYIKF